MNRRYRFVDAEDIKGVMNNSKNAIDNFISSNQQIPELADVNMLYRNLIEDYNLMLRNIDRVYTFASQEADAYMGKKESSLTHLTTFQKQLQMLSESIVTSGSISAVTGTIMATISIANEFSMLGVYGFMTFEELMGMDISTMTEVEKNQYIYSLIMKLNNATSEEKYLEALEKIKPGITQTIQDEIDLYDLNTEREVEVVLAELEFGGTKVKLDYKFKIKSSNAEKLSITQVLFNDAITVKSKVNSLSVDGKNATFDIDKGSLRSGSRVTNEFLGVKMTTSVSVNLTDLAKGQGNVTAKTSSATDDFSSAVTLSVTTDNLYKYGSVGGLVASNYTVERAVSNYTIPNYAGSVIMAAGITFVIIGGIAYAVNNGGDISGFYTLSERVQNIINGLQLSY